VQINEFLLKCSSPPFPILSLICLMLPMISKFTHRRQHSGAVNLATSNIIPHTTMYAPRPVLLLFSVVSAIPICTAGPLAASDRLIFGLQAAFGLENNIPRNISHIKMLYAQPQVGIIVWDSPESRLPIKRFEIVSEGAVGGAIHPGGHLFGDTLMFRVSGNSRRRFVPFFNVSSGTVYSSLDLKATELGAHIQFISQAGGGIPRRLTLERSLVMEYRYLHLSTARLTPTNQGCNDSMLSIGMRWNRMR